MSIDDPTRWYPEVIHVMAAIWTKIIIFVGMQRTARELQQALLALDDNLIQRTGEYPIAPQISAAIGRIERFFSERQEILDEICVTALNQLREEGFVTGPPVDRVTRSDMLFLLRFIESHQGYRFIEISLLPTNLSILRSLPWDEMYASLRCEGREPESSGIVPVLLSRVRFSFEPGQSLQMLSSIRNDPERMAFIPRFQHR